MRPCVATQGSNLGLSLLFPLAKVGKPGPERLMNLTVTGASRRWGHTASVRGRARLTERDVFAVHPCVGQLCLHHVPFRG